MKEQELYQFLLANTYYSDGKLLCRTRWHNRHQIGKDLATKKNANGYWLTSVLGKYYRTHRLIFLLHFGYLPKIIDHINRDKTDNRIENLRESTKTENERNRGKYQTNTTGYKGVWRHKSGSFYVDISVDGKKHRSGPYATVEAAAHGYNEMCNQYHGKFAVLNQVEE